MEDKKKTKGRKSDCANLNFGHDIDKNILNYKSVFSPEHFTD